MLTLTAQAHDFIPTYTEQGVVYEFGDFGKAPNQYATEVGETNVISSKIVTQVENVILINKSFAPSANDLSTDDRGSPGSLRPSSDTTHSPQTAESGLETE